MHHLVETGAFDVVGRSPSRPLKTSDVSQGRKLKFKSPQETVHVQLLGEYYDI